jgi:hypothetical protein
MIVINNDRPMTAIPIWIKKDLLTKNLMKFIF